VHPGRRHEPGGRPNRHGAHEGRGVVEEAHGLLGKRRFARIADGDEHVANEAVAARALDRRTGETRAEGRIVETRQIGEVRRGQILALGELRLASDLSEFVPGADREAIVAAEDPVADLGPQLCRDGALVLDGEVRDAAPGIELERGREGVRRAGVEAAAAGAAMVALASSGADRRW
jgi:hypothetical protein